MKLLFFILVSISISAPVFADYVDCNCSKPFAGNFPGVILFGENSDNDEKIWLKTFSSLNPPTYQSLKIDLENCKETLESFLQSEVCR